MKIGFFGIEGWEEEIVSKRLKGHELVFSSGKIDERNLPKENDFEILSIFINSEMGAKEIEHFPNLKFIAARSTGFDHIDAKAAKKAGVLVSNVPGYGENTVAEFTFGLILSLARKIYPAIDRIKESGSFSLKGLRGMELKGKTIGIVGTGRIGKQVAQIAKGFEMNILANDPYPDKEFQEKMRVEYVPLKELLGRSDVITLHTPHNKDTHHLINKKNIKDIKKGAFFVNTARGAVVETEALVEALQKNILSGAALDVLEEEGEIKDELSFLASAHPQEEVLKNVLYNHVLMDMPNVLITPHNAFNSEEALREILETTLENIEAFMDGKPINLTPRVK
ncbi:MAG: NAD(P)-dependent oxidoreductase [Patescibacteria group bacterium]